MFLDLKQKHQDTIIGINLPSPVVSQYRCARQTLLRLCCAGPEDEDEDEEPPSQSLLWAGFSDYFSLNSIAAMLLGGHPPMPPSTCAGVLASLHTMPGDTGNLLPQVPMDLPAWRSCSTKYRLIHFCLANYPSSCCPSYLHNSGYD